MLSMNYVNDTFLIVLQKSIIEVSSGCLDGMNLYVFFDTVRYCFCKLYKVRHFSGLPFVSQKVKQSNHNLWQGEQKYYNWARCLPKWGTVLAPNE